MTPHEATRFEDQVKAMEARDAAQPPPPGCVMLVGSSTFTRWTSAPVDFAPHPIVNRGFGGSIIPDQLYYMDRLILPWQPAKLIFYCGDNDLGRGHAPEQVMADFREFMRRLRVKLPRTRVWFLGIKYSLARWHLFEQQRLINTAIAGEAPDGALTIDLGVLLMGADGKPRAELFDTDRLHLNRAGYELWIPPLRALLQQP